MVNISLRVLSKPDTHLLSHIFRSLGVDWDERVLPSIGNEILKSVVAQYNAEQLLTQRDRVSRGVSMPPACLWLMYIIIWGRWSLSRPEHCGRTLHPSRFWGWQAQWCAWQ